jgi:hypothetical protein
LVTVPSTTVSPNCGMVTSAIVAAFNFPNMCED